MAKSEWSKPFHGVSHLNGSRREVWATVTDRGSFADLLCWFPGCGFNPLRSMHDSAEEAKAHAEKWIAGQPA